MLRNAATQTFRRGLHTARAQSASASLSVSRHRLALALGTSASVVGYMAWQLSVDQHKIALDAAHATPSRSLDSLAEQTPVPTEHFVSEPHDPKPTTEPPHNSDEAGTQAEAQAEDSVEGEDGSSQAAFDPVTGKINWDCPCLGGMAYGPCGLQFREAFSCFVFSEQDPKGIDCVEKFKAMQQCFKDNPDVYGEEILGEDDDEGVPELTEGTVPAPTSTSASSTEPAPEKQTPSALSDSSTTH